MKLEISSGQRMTLYGEDFDFSTEANDRIGIDYSGGKDMTLGVKADRLIDELSRIIEPTVTIHFTDPSRAVTIQPNDPLYQGEVVDALSKESLRHIEVIEAKGKEVPETFRKLKEQHDEMLSDIHKMLRDVMEEIGEYMNAHDIVQGVDVAINKTIYELVYERKTEDDYENHDEQ